MEHKKKIRRAGHTEVANLPVHEDEVAVAAGDVEREDVLATVVSLR